MQINSYQLLHLIGKNDEDMEIECQFPVMRARGIGEFTSVGNTILSSSGAVWPGDEGR